MSLTKRKRKLLDGTISHDDNWTWIYWDPIKKKKNSLNLGVSTKADAEDRARVLLAEIKTGRIPNLLSQLQRRQSITLAPILEDYVTAGCPDRHHTPRRDTALANCLRDIKNLTAWWGNKHPGTITVADCSDYHTSRVASIARVAADVSRRTTDPASDPSSVTSVTSCSTPEFSTPTSQFSTKRPGHRTVDLELTTLSNILNWAVETRRLSTNPIATGRRRFVRAGTVRHCRESMPSSADELHQLASHLFQTERSTVLGAQLLLEAFTGCRTSEILKLRWDATRVGPTGQPGYNDGQYLWINRSKKGIFPFILLHPALTEFLNSWKQWCKQHYPDSNWYLPGYGSNGQNPPDKAALTHVLADVTPRLQLPHRTSHGLRAYYVTVRRAQGIQDAQIAVELGQSSGAALIVSVYGSVPPNWVGGPELTWIPKDNPPAWHLLQPQIPNLIAL